MEGGGAPTNAVAGEEGGASIIASIVEGGGAATNAVAGEEGGAAVGRGEGMRRSLRIGVREEDHGMEGWGSCRNMGRVGYYH